MPTKLKCILNSSHRDEQLALLFIYDNFSLAHKWFFSSRPNLVGLKIENAIKIIHALTNVSLSKQLIDTRRQQREEKTQA